MFAEEVCDRHVRTPVARTDAHRLTNVGEGRGRGYDIARQQLGESGLWVCAIKSVLSSISLTVDKGCSSLI